MYNDSAYQTHIKSPVEFVIGTRRALGAETGAQFDVQTTWQLGQLLYDSSSPAGWIGEMRWVNASTMLGRSNFASTLSRLWVPCNTRVVECAPHYGK